MLWVLTCAHEHSQHTDHAEFCNDVTILEHNTFAEYYVYVSTECDTYVPWKSSLSLTRVHALDTPFSIEENFDFWGSVKTKTNAITIM